MTSWIVASAPALRWRTPFLPPSRHLRPSRAYRAHDGYGDFLGIGDDHHPTPWSSLKYDTSLGGYRVDITKDELDRAPKYANDNEWSWSRDDDQRVHNYYKAAPYW